MFSSRTVWFSFAVIGTTILIRAVSKLRSNELTVALMVMGTSSLGITLLAAFSVLRSDKVGVLTSRSNLADSVVLAAILSTIGLGFHLI